MKRLSPEEPTARVNLAATLVDARRYAEARREAEEALSVRDDESVRTLLMAIAAITGDAELGSARSAGRQGLSVSVCAACVSTAPRV